MKKLSPHVAETRARWLAQTASACLVDEARLSPKPGLVDSRGNGAHQDLSLALMERSAHSLQPTFHALAQQSWRRPADVALRETVGRLGREGEARMMQATAGVNTHRGAIWALGLLVSATAMLGGRVRHRELRKPPPPWPVCRTPARQRPSVKVCAPAAAGRFRAREKKRSALFRTSPPWRCRSCCAAGPRGPARIRPGLTR